MPDVMADRRQTPRYPLVMMAEVTALSNGAKLVTRTSDVSRTGCYLDTLSPFPKGQQIRVRLAQKGESFEAEATVMYVSKGLGMGLRFQENLAPQQVAILERWLEEAAKKL
jgi:PilZ domain